MVVRLQDSILVFGGMLRYREATPRNIWVYNLYTEQWRKYATDESKRAPPAKGLTCGIAIEQDIYVVTWEPENNTHATLWKLTRNRKGYFSWSDIVVERLPSFRSNGGAWEYGKKLWMFGGHGPHPAEDGYINEYVDFVHSFYFSDSRTGQITQYGANNQLICFEPSRREWTSLKCSGNVPSPDPEQRHGHSALIGNEAYVYRHQERLSDFHKLDMRNLTWTEIRTVPQIPQLLDDTTVNAITRNQLVLHGRVIEVNKTQHQAQFQTQYLRGEKKTKTWILDVDSMSFREYTATKDFDRTDHRGVGALNSCVMIIGGAHPSQLSLSSEGGMYPSHESAYYPSSYCIRLEPNSLQELAMKMIYENLAALPWKLLPMKLIQKIMGTSPEEDIEAHVHKIMETSS